MAVDRNQLANALRVDAVYSGGSWDVPETGEILDRVLSVAEVLVEDYASGAPQVVKDEAVIRVAGWLYDGPTFEESTALRLSGADSLLTRWRIRRAGVIG